MVRQALAVLCGIAVFLVVNAVAVAMVEGSLLSDAARDTSLAIMTLAVPALLGGLVIGWFTAPRALTAGVGVGLALLVAGFIHTFWRIGAVSFAARHSGLLHYLMHNPIALLAFLALGAWIGGEVKSGRITLADPPDAVQPGLEE